MKYYKSGLVMASLVISTLFITPAVASNADIRFGAGVAPQYGGLGGSVQRVTDDDLLAFGVGVIGYSSLEGTAVGAAISYQRADLVGTRAGEPNRHALGMMAGAVGNETSARFADGRWQNTSNDPIWGGAVTYHYYLNGIRHRGFVTGVSLTHGRGSHRTVTGGGITLGYQF